MNLRSTLALGALATWLAGCAGSTPTELPPPIDDPVVTFEAQAIAAAVSGELRPPEDLALRVAGELEEIRTRWIAIVPPVDEIGFRSPWVVNQVVLGLSEEAARQVTNGEYTAWDELNEQHGLTDVDDRLLEVLRSVRLSFDGIFNARVLASLYEELPGVLYAEPNGIVGDGPLLLPLVEGDFASYLFRNAWGDCPAGCIEEEFWYFEVVAGSDYVGHWDRQKTPEPPSWWERAQRNVDLYSTF